MCEQLIAEGVGYGRGKGGDEGAGHERRELDLDGALIARSQAGKSREGRLDEQELLLLLRLALRVPESEVRLRVT